MSNSFSINHHFQNGDSGYRLPAITETAELVEKILLWPPPVRRAAIGLWLGETGLTLSEFWDIAALLLEGEVAL